uniref:RAB GTPase activating protein 1-like 2 n=1 Tax=Neogobius melanostomus TaxID=47308 RepID=A0A8C6TVT7_9GOBI
MMQEVATFLANDALVAEELCEEEILMCLGADSGPNFTVPTEKGERRKSRLQIMDDEEEEPLGKYLKENERLQQASLRLEQENDSLAQRLISSKVALRRALDQAEDQVDQLSKELVQTQHQLKSTQEQMKSRDEEAVMLKAVFRRELEKADENIQRTSGITADYKQICSQLTERLERQQAAHKQEMDVIKTAVAACSSCSHALQTLETSSEHQHQGEDMSPACAPSREGPRDSSSNSSRTDRETFREQITELEQELARTKLQMVEAKCRIQELEHEAGILNSSLQAARNTWLHKAMTSLRNSGAAARRSLESSPSIWDDGTWYMTGRGPVAVSVTPYRMKLYAEEEARREQRQKQRASENV